MRVYRQLQFQGPRAFLPVPSGKRAYWLKHRVHGRATKLSMPMHGLIFVMNVHGKWITLLIDRNTQRLCKASTQLPGDAAREVDVHHAHKLSAALMQLLQPGVQVLEFLTKPIADERALHGACDVGHLRCGWGCCFKRHQVTHVQPMVEGEPLCERVVV